jgi:bifunctional DNA-binding transcriptional regulator/antitoxin component of YhaV-PrlF toxin-antitoxin module
MHRMFETEISQDGEIRLPDEIRHDLGIENARKVIVLVDDGLLRIIPLRMSLEEVRGSAPALSNLSEDFDEEIETAIELAIREKYG